MFAVCTLTGTIEFMPSFLFAFAEHEVTSEWIATGHFQAPNILRCSVCHGITILNAIPLALIAFVHHGTTKAPVNIVQTQTQDKFELGTLNPPSVTTIGRQSGGIIALSFFHKGVMCCSLLLSLDSMYFLAQRMGPTFHGHHRTNMKMFRVRVKIRPTTRMTSLFIQPLISIVMV